MNRVIEASELITSEVDASEVYRSNFYNINCFFTKSATWVNHASSDGSWNMRTDYNITLWPGDE